MLIVMAEADLHEGYPRQDHGDHQQRGGDQFGRARSGGGRPAAMGIVTIMSIVGVRGVRCMRAVIGSGSPLLRTRRRTLAGATSPRAHQRDNSGQYGAEQG